MKFDIYIGDEINRYVLGKAGAKSLAIFGINPSRADQCNSDPTIDKVEKLISAWNFNGFLMLNLYPFRTPYTKNLPKNEDVGLIKRNSKRVCEELEKLKVRQVWAAWGNAFDKRDYFKESLVEILRATKHLDLEWKNCESLTNSQNPRHPLSGRPHIITEQSQLTEFDVAEYLSRKKQS